jgi:hypothetical protein
MATVATVASQTGYARRTVQEYAQKHKRVQASKVKGAWVIHSHTLGKKKDKKKDSIKVPHTARREAARQAVARAPKGRRPR